MDYVDWDARLEDVGPGTLSSGTHGTNTSSPGDHGTYNLGSSSAPEWEHHEPTRLRCQDDQLRLQPGLAHRGLAEPLAGKQVTDQLIHSMYTDLIVLDTQTSQPPPPARLPRPQKQGDLPLWKD